jgi:hypothetical protein
MVKKKNRQIAVGCKLHPQHYEKLSRYADQIGISVSAFVKGAVARRIAEFELAELKERLEKEADDSEINL